MFNAVEFMLICLVAQAAVTDLAVRKIPNLLVASGLVLALLLQWPHGLRWEPVLPWLAGTLGGLSAVIAEGKRAITVRVNDVVGVAGFALPGNFVDIIVHTQTDGSGRDQEISKIVLERILVLAVAQEVSRDDTKPRVVNAVTLEVTPAQAENLDLARSVGSLSLALRNQVDPRPGVTGGATKATMLGQHAARVTDSAPLAAVAPLPVPPVPTVQLAHAVARQVEQHCIAVIDGMRSSRECL